MAYKQFAAGEEALAADVNSYLMAQTVARFANASARTAAITAPVLNQATMLDTTPGQVDYWNGTTWLPLGAGAELAYNQITTNASITATNLGTSQLVVDGTSRTYDGQPVLIEFFTGSLVSPGANLTVRIVLYDDTTALGDMGAVNNAAGAHNGPVAMKMRLTPAAGTHKYLARSWVTAGTATVLAGPGTANNPVPAFLRVTRV